MSKILAPYIRVLSLLRISTGTSDFTRRSESGKALMLSVFCYSNANSAPCYKKERQLCEQD